MRIRLRLDATETVFRGEIIRFLEGCKRYVLVHHVLPHGNPHYHAFIDDPMVMSIDAYRARVKRQFKTTRGDYSVQKCDDEREHEYVQYLFNTKHGNISTLVSSVYDPDVLSECQRKAQEVTEAYEETRKKTESKSRLTIFDLGLEVAEIYDATHPEKDCVSIGAIASIAIDVCYKNRQSPEPNKLNKIISVVLSKSTPGREVLQRKCQNYFSQL